MTSPVGSHSSRTFTSSLNVSSSSTRAAVRFNGGAAQLWLAFATQYQANISLKFKYLRRMTWIFYFAQFASFARRGKFTSITSTRVCVWTLVMGSILTRKNVQHFCCERSFRMLCYVRINELTVWITLERKDTISQDLFCICECAMVTYRECVWLLLFKANTLMPIHTRSFCLE